MARREIINEIAALRNLGPVSAELMYRAGVRSAQEVLDADAHALYEDIADFAGTMVSKNLLRAILGAQRDEHFADVDLEA